MQWTAGAMQALEEFLEKVKRDCVKSGIDPTQTIEQFRFRLEDLLRRQNHDEVTERIVLELANHVWAVHRGKRRGKKTLFTGGLREPLAWSRRPSREGKDVKNHVRRFPLKLTATVNNIRVSLVTFGLEKLKNGMGLFRTWWGRGVVKFGRVTLPSRLWWKSHWPVVLGVIFSLLLLSINFWVYRSNFQEQDWFPTWGHVLLTISVPLSILLERALRDSSRGLLPVWIRVLTGVGVATASIYTWAVGLSPLSLNQNLEFWSWSHFLLFIPIFSLIATVHVWTRLSRSGSRWLWVGVLGATVFISSFQASKTWTLIAMKGAMKGSFTVKTRAVAFLRAYGREDVLLDACDGRFSISPLDVWGRLVTWEPEHDDARRLFFQVTGRSYTDLSVFSGVLAWNDRLAQGGTVVGDFEKDLSLLTSQFLVTPSPDALTAFMEWKMEFENNKQYAHPVRALIALPPGSVVTGLSLGINGQERETLFQYSGKPRDDDQFNGRSRHSLEHATVTSAGLDRVFLQCFPVAPQGGRLLVTLGITTPLVSNNPSEAEMFGPSFIERNFVVPVPLRHDQINFIDGEKDIHNRLTEEFLSSGEAWNVWPRNPLAKTVWTPDPLNPSRFFQQDIFWHEQKLEECVIVLDSSVGLAPFRGVLKEVFLSFPKDVKVFLGRDGYPQFYSVKDLLSRWDRLEFIGGQDNLPALLAGFESSQALGPRSVVWIHGPQFVELSSPVPLRRFLDSWGQRGWDYRTLYSWQIAPGPHKTLEWLDGLENVKTLRLGNRVGLDPKRLFESTSPARRISLLETPKYAPQGKKTNMAVAQLGARERVVLSLLGRWENDTDNPILIQDKAIQQAIGYHLVTPVTGAISPPQDQKEMDAPLGVNRKSIDNGAKAHQDSQCLLSIGSEPSKVCQGRSYLPWDYAHPDILIKQFVCELGHPSRLSWARTPVPTWLGLFPLFYLLFSQERSFTKNRRWRWITVIMGLYSASFLIFPPYAVTLSGIMAGAFLLMLHQPGEPQIKITMAVVFLTLPASAFLLEGFVKSAFVPFGTWPFQGFISSEPYFFLAKFAWVLTLCGALGMCVADKMRRGEQIFLH